MRRSALIAVLAVGLSIRLRRDSFCQDTSSIRPPPPPPPPAWNWAGLLHRRHISATAGVSSNVTVDFISGRNRRHRWRQHRYRSSGRGPWRRANGLQLAVWKLGARVEADIQGSGQRGSITLICAACSVSGAVTTSLTEKLRWFGTVRGRLGWTVTPETMIYATGGLAYGEIYRQRQHQRRRHHPPHSVSAKTSIGWAAGGGVESHTHRRTGRGNSNTCSSR